MCTPGVCMKMYVKMCAFVYLLVNESNSYSHKEESGGGADDRIDGVRAHLYSITAHLCVHLNVFSLFSLKCDCMILKMHSFIFFCNV